jgi:type II secretory pathway component GspD/PulD (secretin)
MTMESLEGWRSIVPPVMGAILKADGWSDGVPSLTVARAMQASFKLNWRGRRKRNVETRIAGPARRPVAWLQEVPPGESDPPTQGTIRSSAEIRLRGAALIEAHPRGMFVHAGPVRPRSCSKMFDRKQGLDQVACLQGSSMVIRMAIGLAFGMAIGLPNSWGQQRDVAQLAHPEIAQQLSLTDDQRAQIQSLLQQRNDAILAAAEADRKTVTAQWDDKVAAVLNADQLKQWKSPPAGEKLRFQFSDMKWADVLQWFSRQEGLTLVMDRIPPGEFTYSDLREYSPSEAIDLLNSVLLTRGFTLVRREKMLIVLELSDSIPIELIPKVTLEQLESRGKFELVSVLFPLGARPIDAVLNEVKPYLGNYGRAVPLAQSRQLLVIESAGKMRTINGLISSVPEPRKEPPPPQPAPPPQPVFAAYPIADLDPQQTLETLKTLLKTEQITVDDKTKVVSAFLIPTQQAAVKDAIETMVQNHSQASLWQTITYPAGGLDPEVLATQLESIAPRAKVVADPKSASLVVTALAADHQVIGELFKALPKTEMRTLQIHPVTSMQKERLATIGTALPDSLKKITMTVAAESDEVLVWGTEAEQTEFVKLLEKLHGNQPPNIEPSVLKRYELPKGANAQWKLLEPDLKKRLTPMQWTYDATESLIWAFGPETRHDQLAQTLKEMIQPPSADRQPVLLTYPLKHAEASGLATLMTGLFPNASIVPDAKRKMLLVTATLEDHAKIKAALQPLDDASEMTTQVEVKQYEVNGLPATSVVTLLQSMWANATISSDATSGKIIVSGTPLEHQQIAAMVQKLNSTNPADPVEIQTYEVPHGELTTIVTILTQIAPKCTITPDAASRKLTVYGPVSQQKRLSDALEKILKANAPDPTGKEVRLIPIDPTVTDAITASTAIKALLPASVNLLPNSSTGTITMTGQPDQLDQAEALLDKLLIGMKPKKPVQKSYSLGMLDGVSTVRLLTTMIPRATATVDTATGALFVLGVEEDHQRVEEILQQLRGVAGGPVPELRFYEVKAVSSTSLLTSLQSLYKKATFSVDATSGKLIALATPDEHQQVQTTIDQFHQASKESPMEVRTYAVPYGDLTTLPTLLLRIAPKSTPSFDATGRTLTLFGPQSEQLVVADTLAKLQEASQSATGGKQVRLLLIDPLVTDALSASTALKSLVPAGVSLLPNSSTGTILATGTTEQLDEVARQLEQILAPGMARKATNRSFSIEGLDDTSLARLMLSMVPKATTAIDTKSRTLFATGSQEDLAKIEEILKQLQTAEGEAAQEIRVYEIRGVAPSAVLLALQGLQKNMVFGVEPATGKIVGLGTPQEHSMVQKTIDAFHAASPETPMEVKTYPAPYGDLTTLPTVFAKIAPRTTISVDPVGRAVTAFGPPDEMQRVSDALSKLKETSESAAQRGTVRLFRIDWRSTDAASAVAALRPALPPGVILQPNSSTGTITASGTPEQLAMVEQLLKTLGEGSSQRFTPKTYSIGGLDAAQVENLIEDLVPRSRTAYDSRSGQLLVNASEDDHQRIAELLKQVSALPADGAAVRTVPVRYGDPESIENALERSLGRRGTMSIMADEQSSSVYLVGKADEVAAAEKLIAELDRPMGATKSWQVYSLGRLDPASFRSAVDAMYRELPPGRAPTIHLDEANQKMLVGANAEQMEQIRKLMEQLGGADVAASAKSANMRTIPMTREAAKAIQEIQRVWPMMRGNRLQVIDPSQMSPQGADSLPDGAMENSDEPQVPDAEEALVDRLQEEAIATDPKLQEAIQRDAVKTEAGGQVALALPPVILIPGVDRWTIASEDAQALEDLERLLQMTTAARIVPTMQSGNYTIYLLKHAGAQEMTEILETLFQRRSSSGSSGGTRPVFTSDARTNALMIYSNPSDRQVIEELLSVLDARELGDSLQRILPKLVPLQHADASQVLDIVRDVYRSSINAEAGRRPLRIPEGVSSEVALLMQQINASSSGPLLTVGVDETTNSIVLRAPADLAKEVTEFIEQMDRQSIEKPASRVLVVPLKSVNAERIEKAIESLLRGRR